jgi:hypothetical protein
LATEANTWGVLAGMASRVMGSLMGKTDDRVAVPALTLWGVAVLTTFLATAAMAQSTDGLTVQPQGLNRSGIYILRQLDPNLTGENVRMGVICRSNTYLNGRPQNDYRPNVDHVCFRNAKLHFYDTGDPQAGVSSHETAICSILFGQDSSGAAPDVSPFRYEGALPEADGYIFEFWYFLTKYVAEQKAPAVDVLAASFGDPCEAWWTKGMESLIERSGLPIIASIGNGTDNGTDVADPPLYPAAGSNTIGVGVVSSVKTTNPATKLAYFSLAYPEHSSLGPTADGRCKPDLIAPGNCLVATGEGDHAYMASGDWSSYSAPVTAGVVGSLVQAAKMDTGLSAAVSGQGGNCVIKAILMTAATKLPYWHKGRLSPDDDHEVPLDNIQGAGMVDAVASYRLLKAGQNKGPDARPAGWDLNRIGSKLGAEHVYRIVVDEPANGMITATLTWNRHYRKSYPFDRIAGSDSDLRLELWAVNPADPGANVLVDYSDSKTDNVEHVYAQALPGFSTYELVVAFGGADARIAAKISEQYAVAWSTGPRSGTDSIFLYDLNGDGVVDEADLKILLDNAKTGLTSPNAYVLGDINGDGVIDSKDLADMMAKRDAKADWYTAPATN